MTDWIAAGHKYADPAPCSPKDTRNYEIVRGLVGVVESVLALHPFEKYSLYDSYFDRFDEVKGCPTCQTDFKCSTRQACLDAHND